MSYFVKVCVISAMEISIEIMCSGNKLFIRLMHHLFPNCLIKTLS